MKIPKLPNNSTRPPIINKNISNFNNKLENSIQNG